MGAGGCGRIGGHGGGSGGGGGGRGGGGGGGGGRGGRRGGAGVAAGARAAGFGACGGGNEAARAWGFDVPFAYYASPRAFGVLRADEADGDAATKLDDLVARRRVTMGGDGAPAAGAAAKQEA